jgi:hypothetical protein
MGGSSREAVQVHYGPSQVMMKFPASGVIHGQVEHAVTKNRKAGLSQANTTRRGENNAQQKQHKGEETTRDDQRFLLMRLKVLMLNQNLRRDGVEFLIGKTSQSIQVN